MNTSKDAWEQAAKTLADLIAGHDVRTLGDDELLAGTAAIERLGRLIDAARATAAGEVADRSRRELGTEGLAATRGAGTRTNCCNGSRWSPPAPRRGGSGWAGRPDPA